MKAQKVIVGIIAIIMAVVLSFSLCGCWDSNMFINERQSSDSSGFSDNNESRSSNDQRNLEVILLTGEMIDEQFLYAPNETNNGETYKLIDSYTDGERYYYCIDLGVIYNVPVTTPDMIEYTAVGAGYKRQYVFTKITTKSVETAKRTLISRLEYDNHVAGRSFSAEVEVGVFERFNFKVGGSYSKQFYSDTTTTEDENSEKYSEEVTISESQTVELSFDSNCPNGSYRLCRAQDFDVYAYVVKDISSGEIIIEYQTVPRNYIINLFEYTAEKRFPDNKGIKDFDFDPQIVNSFPTPTKEYSQQNTQPVVIEKIAPETFTLTPSNKTSITVNDTTQNGYFKFDLTDLKSTMREFDLSVVKIDIYVYITEINDGYQELFLVNQTEPSWNWNKSTHSFDKNIKIFEKKDIETAPGKKGSGNYSASVRTNLQMIDLAENLYLYCGAHGSSGDDKWTASNVKLILTFNRNITPII